ncbi:hypothetical protein L198_05351 [Cryptococcus wingfieldii CBS 7118]|uniref:Uncharacterized protein n=1 Tax=Cryptococcus wingfieldii CBS 7118 TaxID=1295528 RepID=A0A1E3J007_9TREE|nr:hypothetical protein L198_05351 [Cryptococcus wingfieldii CBS 7118]ODN93486.1 hypothetical protein L198_05351 [Cryptococcus wingfieldii CBS 7118]
MVEFESGAGSSRRLPGGVKDGIRGAGSDFQPGSVPIQSQQAGESPPPSLPTPLRAPFELETPIRDDTGYISNDTRGPSSISPHDCAPMSSRLLDHGLSVLELDEMGISSAIGEQHDCNVKASLDEALASCIGIRSRCVEYAQGTKEGGCEEDPDATPKAEKATMDLRHQTRHSIHGSETTSPSMSSMCLSPASSCVSDSSPSETSDPTGSVQMSDSWSEKTPTKNEIRFMDGAFEEEREGQDEGECSTTIRITGFASGLFTSSSESDSEDEADDERDETRKENIVFSDDELNEWSDSDVEDSGDEEESGEDGDESGEEEGGEEEGDEGDAETRQRPHPLLAPPLLAEPCRPPILPSSIHSIFVAASFRSDSSSDNGDGSDRDDPDEDAALFLPQSPWLIETPPVAAASALPEELPSRSPPARNSPPHSQSSSPPSQSPPAPQGYECPPTPPTPRFVMTEAPALPVYEAHRPIPIRFPVYPCAYYASHYMSVSYSAQGSWNSNSNLTSNGPLSGRREVSETERLDEEWAKKEEEKLREEEEDQGRIRKYAQEYSIRAYRL